MLYYRLIVAMQFDIAVWIYLKVGYCMSDMNEMEENTEKNTDINNKKAKSNESYKLMRSRLRGHASIYQKFPIYYSILFIPLVVYTWLKDKQMCIVTSSIFVLYVFITVTLYFVDKKRYIKELVEFATDYTQIQRRLIKGIELPYGLIDTDGKMLWYNNALENMCGNVEMKSIESVFHEIKMDIIDFNSENERPSTYLTYDSKFYRVDFVKIPLEEEFVSQNGKKHNTPASDEADSREVPQKEQKKKEKQQADIAGTGRYLIAMYFFDETEINRLTKENADQKMVAGLIYLDNYDDALESVEDVRRSLLIGLIDRKINKYFATYNAVVRKLEKDKYFIAIKQKYVSALQSNKFSILDEVRGVNIGNEMAVTISIGLGVNGDEYTQNCEYSRIAIDLALGRGGDQAVVKDGEKIYFYGGKSKQVEKNTRVKARVKAHALRELLETKEKVIIMGHKIGDIDSLGSAIGILRAVKTLNKQAYIVINEITSSIRPMLDLLNQDEEYENVFINSEEARAIVDINTAIVVVDVSRPSYVECPEILLKSKAVVVLDHHRRSSDIIENASLSYIEPYASSASEMVAEILQYFYDGIKIRVIEAEAMYAGIMIDTNNFSKNTGVRTFEAAAFLRKCGVDVARIRQIFRDSMEDYKAKAKAISSAEVFDEKYAIAVCPSEGLDSPTVVGAQVANELLNIRGIKASFVLTEHNSRIYISARSTGDLSVQLIMEKLGGGGHLDTAGAQLENVSINEAKEIVKKTVIMMVREKDV